MATNPRVTAKLLGVNEAMAQLDKLPEASRECFGAASETSAKYAAGQARWLAPVRKTKSKGGYAGGALRSRIGTSLDPRTGIASVGIEKGVLVVRRDSGRTWLLKERYGQRSKIVQKGRRKGMYVRTGGKVLLRTAERAAVQANGGLIVQPTKYGHFTELGRGGRHGQARFMAWLRPAMERANEFFLVQMRRAAVAVEAQLREMGYKP